MAVETVIKRPSKISPVYDLQVTNEIDVANITKIYPVGSWVYVSKTGNMYNLDKEGNWNLVPKVT